MKILLAVLAVPCVALAAADAPVSLTASDGTGLKLVKLQARAVVNDPLAYTELQLTFENPLDRVLEGQFKVTLPQGAAISRFAMKVDGRWQEGEVVERQAARRAYEDFLHRRQDPALLEQSGGNEFSARVFPIPARGVKELVLSYSHELVQRTADYVLPLAGLPEVGELDVAVSGITGQATLSKKRFVPSQDFVGAPVRSQAGVRSGDLVALRVVPVAATEAEPVTALTVLVDSSGSRALGWRQQVGLVQQVLAALAKTQPALPVAVVAFDQEVKPLYAGPASGFGEPQAKALRDRLALGASNLELALKAALAKPTARVLLVTDGVATAGPTDALNLQATLLKLKAAGVQRLDAIAVGGIRDEAALARLTVGSLPRDGAVLDGALAPAELARRLSLATRSTLTVKVEGATEAWPATLSGLQAGDAALVYAQLPAGAPLKLSLGGKPVAVAAKDVVSIERPLLERAWARARLAGLDERLARADSPAEREKLKASIVALSTKSRVLSSLTALLVLETEADYARFRIDRRALSDLLVVEGGAVKVLQRRPESLAAVTVAPPRPPAKADPNGESASKGKAEKKSADAKDVMTGDDGPAAGAPAPEPVEAAKVAAASPPPPPAAKPAPSRAGPSGGATAPSSVQRAPSSPRPVPMEASERLDTAERERDEPMPQAEERPRPGSSAGRAERRAEGPKKGAEPYVGRFKAVMDAVRGAQQQKAVDLARGWLEETPGDLLALVALGEALEAKGEVATAARAYGSIIDLFPARADLRRFAGVRLERLAGVGELAADTFAKAAEQRPDHPASHRLLAFSLLRLGKLEQAFAAISAGVQQAYPDGRFRGVDRILREDAGLVAAAWVKAEPKRKAEILSKLQALGAALETGPSLRFVLNWETDANDVDFHIYDGKGGHAYYSQMRLASGGELYADVTTGYGPECFTIRLPRGQRAYPYTLQAHYYSIGPMGAGMGKLELIEHDGEGGLRFEQRPYVVMVNQAYVDLGVVKP